MIRLAVLGEQADRYVKLAPRVRGACLAEIRDIQELDTQAFDAVVICPTAAPNASCRFAAAHGKHIFFTAPPDSSEEARTLVRECRTQNVRLMGSLSARFLPSLQTIKQSLDAGRLGDPGLIRIHRWSSGVDIENGFVVDVDLAIWMFRALPTEVYAVWNPYQPHGYLQVHLGFPGGGMGLIDVSTMPFAVDGYFSLSLIGSRGAAYADDHHNQQLLFRGEHSVALKTGEGDVARLAQLQEFVDAIHEQREPAVTGADEEAALLVAGAAWQSIHSARTARLSGDRYEC